MLLRNLSIQNFRSIYHATVDVNRLNIVVGANDGGKSNLLRSIRAYLDTQYKISLSDYPKFARLSGSGNVDSTAINMIGNFILNADSGSEKVKKLSNRFISLETITRTNDNYDMKITYYDSNGNVRATNETDVAKVSAYLPIFHHIDLALAYTSLEDGNWLDLANSIEKTINRFTTKEDRHTAKTTINSILGDFWGSDQQSLVSISMDGTEVEIECSDKYRVNCMLEQRGTGFQAFLFVALRILNAIYDAGAAKKDIVFTIEEPERMLHPQGQHDFIKLIQYFIKDNPSITFFISTHSPIIVKTEPSANILLVRKNDIGHSYIDAKPHRNNWKALRDDLGMRPSDSLLIGDITIVVEGPCEQLYLPILFDKYCDVDISLFNFISAEGVTNTSFYIKLIKDLHTNLIVILDNDKQGREIRKKLERDNIIDRSHIFSYDGKNGQDIAFEDVFDESILLNATKNVYSDKLEGIEFSENMLHFSSSHPNSDFEKLCWATRIGEFLSSKKVIDDKKDLDKLSICKFCIEQLDECPEQIAALANKIKKLLHC